MIELRLLHISDLHIAKKHRNLFLKTFSPTKFNSLGDAIDLYRDQLSGFLITGDIADTGKELDLCYAYNLLFPSEPIDSKIDKTKSLYPLDFGEKPVILMPGNHDRFHSFRSGPPLGPGSTNFDSIFAAHWISSQGIAVHLLPCETDPKLMIACADLTLSHVDDCDPIIYYMGRGKVYSNRLEQLKEVTIEYSNKDIPVIWAIHFSPDDKDKTIIGSKIKLEGSSSLIKMANELDVNYIFCGHYHVNDKYPPYASSQKLTVFCSGSPTYPEKGPPSIQLITVRLKDNVIDDVVVVPLLHNGRNFEEYEKNNEKENGHNSCVSK